MSLESKIEALTQAVTALTAQLQAGNGNVQVAAPQVQAPAPAPVAPPAVAMPAPPTFAATPPAPVAAPVVAAAPAPVMACPFSDTPGLIQYVMSAYQSMGPEKGQRIGGLLQQMGCANINDVKPEQFGQLYAGIEQLKAS